MGGLSCDRNFYPRSPCGERPAGVFSCYLDNIISIHALLAESDARRESRQQPAGISIHALLAESDLHLYASSGVDFIISIHALLAESDPLSGLLCCLIAKFLSTLSLRRATGGCGRGVMPCRISIHALLAESDCFPRSYGQGCTYFYPRSPCGERPRRPAERGSVGRISIHALLAESDACDVQRVEQPRISIHALLAESDVHIGGNLFHIRYFYPRSPCGERRKHS